MTALAAVFLLAGLVCLVGGAWMLLPAVGVLIAGVLFLAVGVLSLDPARSRSRSRGGEE